MPPKLFTGSSVEGPPVAYAIQENVERQCEPTVWTQDVFSLNQSSLSSLLDALDQFDAGVFCATADDLTQRRGNEKLTARDEPPRELNCPGFPGPVHSAAIPAVCRLVASGSDDRQRCMPLRTCQRMSDARTQLAQRDLQMTDLVVRLSGLTTERAAAADAYRIVRAQYLTRYAALDSPRDLPG